MLKDILESVAAGKYRNIMLTGGRSAVQVYDRYRLINPFSDGCIKNTNIFFTDERCVPPNHLENNHRLVVSTLFGGQVPRHLKIHPMESELSNLDLACKRYEMLLPESLDLLILSMGDDGHIASIFPHSLAIRECKSLVMKSINPYSMQKRITITPRVIRAAKSIIIFALGQEKRKFYEEVVLRDPLDVEAIPARLVLGRNWVFDLSELEI